MSRRTRLAPEAPAGLVALIRRRKAVLAARGGRRSVTALALAVVVGMPAAPARGAEPVLDWNARAVTALIAAGTTPIPNLRGLTRRRAPVQVTAGDCARHH